GCVSVLAGTGRLERHIVDVQAEPAWAHADPTRLDQIVSNLLANAAKYTPPGGTIRVRVRGEGDEAVVRVADTGIGIPVGLLPRIFDLFVQGERGLDRAKQEGLGVGLTLVRRLVGLHGGRVEASSDGPGRGSEFVVRLHLIALTGFGQPRDYQRGPGSDFDAYLMKPVDPEELVRTIGTVAPTRG